MNGGSADMIRDSNTICKNFSRMENRLSWTFPTSPQSLDSATQTPSATAV